MGRRNFSRVENGLALYTPFESPWAEIKTNHLVEMRLFELMRAEVRLWRLQNDLAAAPGPDLESAQEVGRIVHARVLNDAAETVALLKKTPNKGFAELLLHQIEAYPYEWKEEGAEELLPALHKMVDPAEGKAEKPKPKPKRTREQEKPPAADATATPAASAIPEEETAPRRRKRRPQPTPSAL